MRRFFVLAAAAASLSWTNQVPMNVSPHAGSGGGASTPAEEGDFGYFHCPDDGKAARAMDGEIDWVDSTTEAYCRQRHGHEDDSPKNFWRRSRHIRGCQANLLLFNNPVYRCWDVRTDGGADAVSAQEAQIKAQMYEAWQSRYREKTRITLEQTEAERASLDSDAANARLEMARLERLREARARSEARLKARFEKFGSYHRRFLERLAKRQAAYDELSRRLQRALIHDAADLERLARWVQTTADEVMSETVTLERLGQLRSQVVVWQESCTLKVCDESRSVRALRALRESQAATSAMSYEYAAEAERALGDSDSARARAVMEQRVTTVYKAADRMSSVFGAASDEILRRPKACDGFARLPSLVELRIALAQTEGVQVALGQISRDFEQRLVEADLRYEARRELTRLSQRLTVIPGRIAVALQEGKASEARQLQVEAELTVPALLTRARTQAGAAAAEIGALEAQAEATLARIRRELGGRLSLEGITLLITERLDRLAVEMTRLDDAEPAGTANGDAWHRGTRPTIYRSLGLRDGDSLIRPRLSSVEEAFEYDARIAGAEALIETFRTQVLGGP
jgi:hypothetical protein